MSFLFGAGASLLSAASQQLASYFEYEVEQAELADQQHQHYQHQHQPAPHQSPPRRISLPSHHLLSSPSLPTPPHSTTLLSSPTHSLISTSALFDHSTHSTYSQPTCTCTTAHSTATDYTLTAFTVEFAAALSEHPSTFHGFPACCEWSDRFHLSAVQLVHARRLLSECGAFGELRRRVREEWAVSEFEFWRVYFLLRINVNTREREQRRRQRCSPQEARRRSARGEDGLERNKENVRPTSGSNKDKLVQARGDVHGAKGRSTQQQYQKEEVEEEEEVVDEASADGVECVAEKQEEQRYEQQRTIWSEVDRLMLTLASVRPQPSASSAPTTPSKATLLVTALQLSPASVNDSACSDRYASPSPQKPCGQLFHRLTADEQQTVTDMLTSQMQQRRQDEDEQREVSRLVFSPTPSLDGSLSDCDWDGGTSDSESRLDLSVCSASPLSDSSSDCLPELELSYDSVLHAR